MKKSRKNNVLSELERKAEKYYTQFKHVLPHPWEKKLAQLTKQIGHLDFAPGKNRLVQEARKNLKIILNKVEKSDMAHTVKNLAKANGHKILGLLNFPTKKEVSRLSARLGQLEKRFQSLR